MADDLTTYDDFMAQQEKYARSAHKRAERSSRKNSKRCLGKTLIAFNVIFLIMGATMVGFGVHINLSKENKLTQDTISIGVISMGALFLVVSTIGICGVCLDSKCVVTVFDIVLIIMAAAQIAVAVIVLSHGADASNLITDAWKDANNELRTDMQNYFYCCGLTGSSDMAGSPCPPVNGNGIAVPACLNVIMNDLQANYSAVGWISAAVAFLQIVASAIACVMMCNKSGPSAEEALLLDDGRDGKRGRHSKNGGDTFGQTGWISE